MATPPYAFSMRCAGNARATDYPSVYSSWGCCQAYVDKLNSTLDYSSWGLVAGFDDGQKLLKNDGVVEGAGV